MTLHSVYIPLGLPQAFLRPIFLTCTAEGVMVGSLKIDPMRLPASTASCNTYIREVRLE